jgi:hypothetical protein
MRGVQDFLKDSLPAMIDYIAVVSSPVGDTDPAYDPNRLDQLDVTNALYQRSQRTTVLDKESIPVLPHLLDIPKHLAIVTSAVVRSLKSHSLRYKTNDDSRDLAVEQFCSVCSEIEEEALRRVSRLATRLAESRRPSSPANSAVVEEALRFPFPTGHQPFRRCKSRCSSTAQSPSEPHSPIDPQTSFGDNSPATHFCNQFTSDDPVPWDQRHAQAMHMKAPSSDLPPSLVDRDFSLCVSEPPVDTDAGKRKKGLLRGILRR